MNKLDEKHRFPRKVEWAFTLDTVLAAEKIPADTVSEQSHKLGMMHGEPLIMAMDCAMQYANSYHSAYGGRLKDDGVLGEHWLDWVKGLHGLLNGDGAVAMQRGITTDSKCNGAMEEMYWKALAAAGFKEEDL